MRRFARVGLSGLGLLIVGAALFVAFRESPAPADGPTADSRRSTPGVSETDASSTSIDSALIFGQVIQPDDTPAPGCVVRAEQDGRAPLESAANPEGWFTIPRLIPGRSVRLIVPGQKMIPYPVVGLSPGERRLVRLLLPDDRPIVVVVVDVLGHPVPGAKVTAYPVPGAEVKAYRWPAEHREFHAPVAATLPVSVSKEVDANGRTEFRGLPGGQCLLVARRKGFAECEGSVWLRSPGEEITLMLRQPCSLEGRVIDTEGRAVSGAHVGFDYESPTGVRTVADGNGHYRLTSIPAGERTLVAARPGATLRPVATLHLPDVRRFDVVFPVAVTLRGRVFDLRTGTPLAGATVRVDNHWKERSRELTVISREDGSYEFAGLHPGVSSVSVERTGWILPPDPAHGAVRYEGALDTVDLAMVPAACIEGIVTDPLGPVPGAQIRATRQEDYFWIETCSGPDGRFRLTPLGAGTWEVSAEARGHVGVVTPDGAPLVVEVAAGETSDLDVSLERGETNREDEEFEEGETSKNARTIRVRGKAITADGIPATGSRVRVLSGARFYSLVDDPISREPWVGVPWGFVRVTEDGSYEATVEDPERVLLVQGFASGFAPTSPVEVEVSPDLDDYEVNLVLDTGHRVEVRIVSSEARAPIAGAAAALVTPAEGAAHGDWIDGPPPPAVHATSAADGTLVIDRLPSGSFELRVSAPGFVDQSVDVEIPGGEVVLVELQRAHSLGGVVRLAGGSSPGRVEIRVRRAEDREGKAHLSTGRSGRFIVRGLPAGAYLLAIEASYDSKANILGEEHGPYEAGRTDLDITLRPGWIISGTVVGPDGRGVGGATVDADGEDEGGDRSSSGYAFTAEDGGFEIDGLLDLPHDLEVEANGFLSAKLENIAAGASDCRIVLSAGRSISGVLVDSDGGALAGWWVHAVKPGRSGSRHSGDPAIQTDKQGRFTLTGLAKDAYEIALGQPYGALRGETIVLTGAASVPTGTRNARVVAVEGATISGRVTDEGGLPLAGIYVRARPSVYNDGRYSRTDRDGRFAVTGLFPDRNCTLEIEEDDFLARKIEIDRPDGDAVEIRLVRGLDISGRALRLDGSPLRDERLCFRPDDGPDHHASTDRTGRFWARNLPPGRYCVLAYVYDPDGEFVRIEFGEVEAGTKDVALRARR
jgi:Carboxypeptidase regulatory-like domain